MTLEERVKEWPAQWLREGREQGLEQGRKEGLEQGRREGLEHERTLLSRMTALRFGAETGERAAALMADIGDEDQLADVGEWLVRCGAGHEFLARVASIARS